MRTSSSWRAALDDPAVVEDEDLIGAATVDTRCDTMSRRALAHHAAQPLQNLLFGVGIHGRQRIVEHQDCAGRMTSARAIAVRCFWPPESVMPRSPTSVS